MTTSHLNQDIITNSKEFFNSEAQMVNEEIDITKPGGDIPEDEDADEVIKPGGDVPEDEDADEVIKPGGDIPEDEDADEVVKPGKELPQE